MSTARDLFGGAITVQIPIDFVDASTVRQVPDTQEVFFSRETDVSFIVEILQRVDPDDAKEAAKFHFDSLAHDNEATTSSVISITEPGKGCSTATPAPIFLDGLQEIAKFNSQTTDTVRVLLAVYRVASKGIDIVLSANLPVAKESGRGLGGANFDSARGAFIVAAKSLKIVDFGLFA